MHTVTPMTPPIVYRNPIASIIIDSLKFWFLYNQFKRPTFVDELLMRKFITKEPFSEFAYDLT